MDMDLYPARYRIEYRQSPTDPWKKKGNGGNDVRLMGIRCGRLRLTAAKFVGSPQEYRVWDRQAGTVVVEGQS